MKYRQPYSIKEYRRLKEKNPALEYHLRMKTHHEEKYRKRWGKSKLTKRLLNGKRN